MTNPFDRPARPIDLFNRDLGRVETEVAAQRLATCKACDKFIKITSQCSECHCFMPMKTKLPNASCPLGKWGIERVNTGVASDKVAIILDNVVVDVLQANDKLVATLLSKPTMAEVPVDSQVTVGWKYDSKRGTFTAPA